ncbi:hypothetical protein DNTS_025770 [Danionella cerebrum]|uniref:Ig-like domain-containing protein n=1 Tax=Danionella cerebrum TaxID=2873325 RepID=A0A553N4J2_9TELE|nr:hypothetical protein DNTS_025770 [Danionella translucida]
MKDEKIRWRYEGETIAEIDKERNLFTVHEDVLDGRFRNRLKLDDKTGTLTITDIRSEHSGWFFISSKYFNVDFRLSVLKERSVMEGESVSLSSDLTELKDEDLIRWRFGDEETVIAEIDVKTNRFSVFEDVLDGRFRDQLKLDQTGSLTIRNITINHGGRYLLQTRDRNHTVPLRVDGWRRWRIVEVKRGDSVALSSGRTEIMKDEKILWRYKGETIAEFDKKRNLFTVHEDVLDGRFRNRMKLDDKTGTLTITDIRSEHRGWFSVSSEYFIVHFDLLVSEERSVMEGETVSLSCRRDGEWIQWRFGDEETLIAEIEDYGSSADIFEDVLDGRFTDRLKLDSKTGTLTISNIRAEHTGDYRCYQISRLLTVFRVSVYAPVPVVTRDCSSSSEQICSLLCSVNASAATLSWFRGNTLISSINESELSIALSLPLEDQENISYSCELHSMVQTQHLNVSQLCEPCADPGHCCGPTELVIRLVLSALVGVALVLVVMYEVRSGRVERGRTRVRDSQT